MASPLTRERFDAVLFDLDGVLTATAKVHAAAWKEMFDAFLQRWSGEHGRPYQPFTINSDYRLYVDGKSRYEGVRSFLESRDIHLPPGHSDSPPGEHSICGLGNLKDDLVQAVLSSQGVDVYQGSIRLVRHIRQQGMKTAVVSSSRNCQAVLQAADIEELFDARVDGVVAEAQDLPSKPDPEMFLAAARQLAVPPARAVVVEDAIAGVRAGRAGRFGLVVGVARSGDEEALQSAGADVVVRDLGEWC